MPQNFMEWLANGNFFLFAAIIGVIVSIDVFVVEFTREYERDLEAKCWWTRRMRNMLLLHALFHAGSFLIYTFCIYLLQNVLFLFLSIECFDMPDGVVSSLMVLINFVIVCFIWWTYKEKVAEDHSEKSDDSEMEGRRDMKFFVNCYRALSHKVDFADSARGVAVAGSVAVDMLAVSALLKQYLLPHGDNAPISSWTGYTLIDIPLFALVIFAVVCFAVFAAQGLSFLVRDTFKLVFPLRLLEPLAVFFILFGSVRYFLKFLGVDIGFYVDEYGIGIDAIFSVCILFSLLAANCLGYRGLREIYKKGSKDKSSTNQEVDCEELRKEFRSLFIFVFFVLGSLFFAFSIFLWYEYLIYPGEGPRNHILQATGDFSILVLFLSTVLFYTPSPKFDSWETRRISNFIPDSDGQVCKLWGTFIGASLALVTLSIFYFIVLGKITMVSRAIIMWSIYVLLGYLLFNLRRWRFRNVDQRNREETAQGSGRNAADTGRQASLRANVGEMVLAVGLASSLIAIATKLFVLDLMAYFSMATVVGIVIAILGCRSAR